MKFRKRPVVIEATRWFANGDHPHDGNEQFIAPSDGNHYRCEGKVVRYFRHPRVPDDNSCAYCNVTMLEHGWIDTLEDGHIVCPGDWIITGIVGEHYPCKPDIFEKTYEKIEE